MAAEYLTKILEHKKKFIQENRSFYDTIKKRLEATTYNRYRLFKQKISQPNRINLIAEIKKASPSQGLIREDFDVMAIAKTYVAHHADAISVLTEDKYFLGKPAYVKQISDGFNVPVLTKDFIIDSGQLYEARYNGASAVLLIVAILTDKKFNEFYEEATKIDLDCLVEVHDEEELKRALAMDAEIIGINNRNLETFEVDLKTCEKLIPKIPKGKTIVAESGIQTHKDVEALKEMGAHAVLIGETFMRSKDIGKKIEEIMKGM
ncbi:MAG TPA: indole-3-glycerol phosphate synthase TrpC [Candidatus Omnitrophota bacterium]|nr:indole-3-glycerol phosphate synthase TrpC [Candidatus Omnitrophota bacterium]